MGRSIYTNEVGKSRPEGEHTNRESQDRKDWFGQFEHALRQAEPELMKQVELQVVGSVAKGQATAESDIDIVIRTMSSDELLEHKVRKAITELLDHMRESGAKTYSIEVQKVGNPLMFSKVAQFRREHQ